MTVCSGEFKLAGETTSFSAAFLQISATSAGERPRIAAMAPCAGRHGFLHVVSATADQFHRRRKIERARRHQRGIFTQAVAGDEIRRDSLLLQRAIGRGGNRQDCRLRVFGLLQRFFRAFKAKF